LRRILTLIAGFVLGGVSWGVAHAVSGTFEPWDSGTGFLVTQLILSFGSFVVGFRNGIVSSMILVVGSYLGLNAYAFAFGGSETRAWAVLGAVTSLALVLFPALAAVLGGLSRYGLSKSRRGPAP
jgi:hypothetical protein